MKLQILFFASTREVTGLSRLDLEVSNSPYTTDDLKIELEQRYPALKFNQNHINLAINRQYATNVVVLKDGDQVALIPPIAGG